MLAELAMSAPMTGAAVAVEFSKRVGELKLVESVRLIPERPAATRRGDGARWMV